MGVEEARHVAGDGHVYECVGTLTITRAASTQREIDDVPDPLVIDLAKVDKMDTVGAWVVHRAVRDRHAKVRGASKQAAAAITRAIGLPGSDAKRKSCAQRSV